MAKKHKVIVTETLSDGPAAWLAERADVVWCSHEDVAGLARLLPDADGLVVRTYTQVDGALLGQAGKLRVVGRAGVGLDNFDLDACGAAGVRVVYTPDANSQAVVEYVVGLMLDAVRPRTDLPADAGAERFHAMRKMEVGRQLDQMVLGIVGMGRVGGRLGRVANAIGMKVLVAELLEEGELRERHDYPFEYVSHEELYGQADVVSIHVDGRADNRHMVDGAALKRMKENVLLINAARGFLHVNEDLRAFALANPAAKIVLDVHDPEPPTPGNFPAPGSAPGSTVAQGSVPGSAAVNVGAGDAECGKVMGGYCLHGLENVRVLPHIASRTHEALENMSWVVKDVWRVLEGDEPVYAAPGS